MKVLKQSPVGVFDSGVGGLTVAREIMRQLPNENIVYFGDTARVPYGSKSRATIVRFARQILHFLEARGVKAIVIACNTATALALDELKEECRIPVVGVILPGARAAVRETRNQKIGVVGTEATIQSETYTKVIKGLSRRAQVFGRACPLFVPLVEEGFLEHAITGEAIAYYLEEFKTLGVDTMILGCTHYPLLRRRIREYLGEGIHIVNPAYETALDLKGTLAGGGLLNDGGERSLYEFYVSDAADRFKRFADTILPHPVEAISQINIEEY